MTYTRHYNCPIPKKEGETMPLVHIDLLAGRSEDQLHQLVKDVTAAIVKNTGAPAEHVHIVLNEMANNRYSVGGVMKDEDQ
ncbi:2-hydroxymuconate tautomerase [Schleiferilactobacillus harbinensis]|nr:2-hydroxymuconate tautomerase [Schleiferilactobacillus harbinensis]